MSVMSYEGPVQYSTAYSVGDVIIYYGQPYYVSSAIANTGSGINGIGQPSITSGNLVPLSHRRCTTGSYGTPERRR